MALDIAGIDRFAGNRHGWLNLVHTWLLVGGSLGLFVLCAFVFFGPQGTIWAGIFGAISLFFATRMSPQLVLRMYKATPVGNAEFPDGHAILDELARRAGLPAKPALHVAPSNLLNAFAVGRRDESAICLTDALLRNLTLRELAGVLAHEISHIRNEDVKVMAIADMVARFTSTLSSLGILAALINLPPALFGGAQTMPWSGILLLVAAPTVGSLLQLALSRTREYDADLGAAMLTGDPDGLASALMKLERAQRRGWEGMVLPGGRIPDPSILRSHPRTQDRIDRLMALKGADRSGPQAAPRASVPSVGPAWRRGEEERYREYSALLAERAARFMPLVADTREGPACARSLSAPGDGPRIRPLRGGVYW
jgi:heat shock protein HtpX